MTGAQIRGARSPVNSCHSSGAWNFQVAHRFWNICGPVVLVVIILHKRLKSTEFQKIPYVPIMFLRRCWTASLHKFSFIKLLLKNGRFFVSNSFSYWCASLCYVNYKRFTRLLVLVLFFHLHSCQPPFGPTAEQWFRCLSCGTNNNTADTVFYCHFVHIFTLSCLLRRQDSLLQRKNPFICLLIKHVNE